jgi:small subunit ribosomal protein S17
MTETPTAPAKGRRKELVGRVVSNKMQKTVVVAVDRTTHHRLYRRTVRVTKRYYAHDDADSLQIGDVVRIIETRPLSKLKRWRVAEVLRHSQGQPVVIAEPAEATSTVAAAAGAAADIAATVASAAGAAAGAVAGAVEAVATTASEVVGGDRDDTASDDEKPDDRATGGADAPAETSDRTGDEEPAAADVGGRDAASASADAGAAEEESAGATGADGDEPGGAAGTDETSADDAAEGTDEEPPTRQGGRR